MAHVSKGSSGERRIVAGLFSLTQVALLVALPVWRPALAAGPMVPTGSAVSAIPLVTPASPGRTGEQILTLTSMSGASSRTPVADRPRVSAVSQADAAAIRKIIEAQLDALQADDAERAFSYASASIREQFRNAANFLEMVRSGYPVVHHPSSVSFLPPQAIDKTVAQVVRMTDAEGQTWLALYSMQRLPDGVWRINGCRLVRDNSLQT